MKKLNKNLHEAKKAKNDEFYTQLPDIEKELIHYKEHFTNKTVFCNCDDPEESNFWKYFSLNFEFFGLKKLISTHFEKDKPSYKLELVKDINDDGKVNGLDTIKTPLKQNGDFRSPESIEILKESGIIITNPPFSLFREYVAQLIEYDKKFVIIGNLNAITYKEVFPLLKNNKIWLGPSIYSGDREFEIPAYIVDKGKFTGEIREGKYYQRVMGIRWYTNIDHYKRHEVITLFREYNDNDYPKYDNYDAINIDKVKNIPINYKGPMGVPISFMDKYSPDQFEILDANNFIINDKTPIKLHGLIKDKDGTINGKPKYVRVLVRRR